MPRSSRIIMWWVVVAALVSACTGSVPQSQPVPDTTVATGAEGGDARPTTIGSTIPTGVEPIVDTTPLPVDPDVRIGQLDNGLTYYLRSNDSPGRALSVRLAVNAGSLQQVEPTDQMAHFTEHMLFNGTERFPGNQLDAELRALGAQIGPDLNAFTSFDETVYFLDIALDEDNANTAFTVLREWAGNARIDEDAVVAERPVVREEYRLRRRAAGAAVQERFEEVYFAGTPYEGHSPIGTEDQIMSTTSEQARAFYDRWYRPDLMAVVAVGDLPLAELEDLVVEHFSDLERRGDDHPPRKEPAVPLDTPPVVDVLADPGLDQTFISIDYRVPARDSGTFGGEQLDLWDGLITAMIANRVDEAISSGTSSLVRGGGGPFKTARRMSFIGFNLDGPELAAGTSEFVSLLATLARDGFTESELERAKSAARSGLEQELSILDTRQDQEWADLYHQHYLGGADISSPQDRFDRVAGLLDVTSADDLTGYFRWIMETAEPLVIVVGPDPNELPRVAELEAAVSGAAAVDTAPGLIEPIDQLMARPDPVAVTAQRNLPAAGGVEWVFSNGARVVFAESGIAEGVVDIRGRSEGGWSQLAAEEQPLLAPAAEMVGQSGPADVEKVALDRYLADKIVSLKPVAFEVGEGVFGEASTGDLEVAFQLLHLYLTEPRVDQAAFNRVVTQETERLRSVQNRPTAAAAEAIELAFNDDSNDRTPVLDRATLDQLTPERALELYRDRFVGVDDLVLVVVGDVDSATVRDLAERYVGTLPSRPADTWVDLLPDPPLGVVTVERTAGPAGGIGVLSLVFRSQQRFDDQDRVHGEILQAVLEERLFTRIREQLGASYSGGSAAVSFSSEPEPLGEIILSVAGDPDRLDEIRTVVLGELAELDRAVPEAAEYERAVAVVRDRYAFISNGDRIAQLFEESTEDGPVLTNQAATEILARTSPGAVQALAAELIDTDAWVEVFVTPTG